MERQNSIRNVDLCKTESSLDLTYRFTKLGVMGMLGDRDKERVDIALPFVVLCIDRVMKFECSMTVDSTK